MTAANYAVWGRILLTPIALYFFLLGGEMGDYITAVLLVFGITTDFLDGYWARKYGTVSNFGIFFDPTADKILTLSFLIVLSSKGIIPLWVSGLFLVREFFVMGVRVYGATAGIVISAHIWGKLKTGCLFLSLVGIVLTVPFAYEGILLASFFALISAVDYGWILMGALRKVGSAVWVERFNYLLVVKGVLTISLLFQAELFGGGLLLLLFLVGGIDIFYAVHRWRGGLSVGLEQALYFVDHIFISFSLLMMHQDYSLTIGLLLIFVGIQFLIVGLYSFLLAESVGDRLSYRQLFLLGGSYMGWMIALFGFDGSYLDWVVLLMIVYQIYSIVRMIRVKEIKGMILYGLTDDRLSGV